jgi:hypothetical protein
MIKKITLLFTSLLLMQFLSAQELVKRDTIYPEPEPKKEKKTKEPKEQPETLFSGQSSFGGYFGFNFGYSDINGEDAVRGGGRLMFVANHYLGIGFGGQGFVSATTSKPMNNDEVNYTQYANYLGGYGGLYLEPVFFSLKPIHVSMPILLGAGGMGYHQWNNGWDYGFNKTLTTAFFIIEPGLDVEFNIAKWFRIGLGASYRFTSQVDSYVEIPSEALKGFNYGITFKMGWF